MFWCCHVKLIQIHNVTRIMTTKELIYRSNGFLQRVLQWDQNGGYKDDVIYLPNLLSGSLLFSQITFHCWRQISQFLYRLQDAIKKSGCSLSDWLRSLWADNGCKLLERFFVRRSIAEVKETSLMCPFIQIGAWSRQPGNNCEGALPRWLPSAKTHLKEHWLQSQTS